MLCGILQVVATFTQRNESSPAGKTYDTVDANVRSFPHLADTGDTTTRTTTTTTTTSVGKPGRKVGQEHMFHQQVSRAMMCGREGGIS